MDYEKKYKNALEWARKVINGEIGFFRNEVEEEIFPELKESEDERIRKALLRFHASTIDIDGIQGKEILAWIEKQGETFTKKDVDDAYLKGICDAKHELEKQGEQKPILDFKASNFYVSKVDGKIHDMTYNPADKVEPRFKVKYAGSEYNVLEVKDIAGVTFYGIEDEPNHIDYVKAENCEIISGYAIKENGSPYPTKPAAWSDEDDYNLQCMIAKVTSDIQKGNVGRNNELIDWLKSLKQRIGWKPSEEQMEAFEHFVRSFGESGTISPYSDNTKLLYSLLQDLKKL